MLPPSWKCYIYFTSIATFVPLSYYSFRKRVNYGFSVIDKTLYKFKLIHSFGRSYPCDKWENFVRKREEDPTWYIKTANTPNHTSVVLGQVKLVV